MDDIDPEQYEIAKAASADAYALYSDRSYVGGACPSDERLLELYYYAQMA